MPADELFGPDGTQALQVEEPLVDPLGGLVTGASYAAGGNSAQERAEVAAIRVEVPNAPAAPDPGPLKLAMDKAMMTGPQTGPIRLPTNTGRYVRPAPTVRTVAPTVRTAGLLAAAPPVLTRPIVRSDSTRLTAGDDPLVADDEQIRRVMREDFDGRLPLRRRHPIVAGLLRVIIPVAFIVLLLILVLHGSGSGGNLSGLFG